MGRLRVRGEKRTLDPGLSGRRPGERRKREKKESANGLRGPPLCIIKSCDDVAECEVPRRHWCAEKGAENPAGTRVLRKMQPRVPFAAFVAFRFGHKAVGTPYQTSSPCRIPGVTRKHLLVLRQRHHEFLFRRADVERMKLMVEEAWRS
ncbi:uncharacterized protein LOC112213599 [Bombus impatiens]|uniref:Uncharacterized protein LOC112213599 n=1 Tax=Bombus impatiens TaxID=132113 RepID=A0A6P6FFC6_BOMIM|nr:uncharacterized protein LOC112213599 [Bombus impatiens]